MTKASWPAGPLFSYRRSVRPDEPRPSGFPQDAPAADPLAEVFGAPISTYTQRQAIEDGLLVALDDAESAQTVREAGFTIPVLLTAPLFLALVWPIKEEDPAAVAWLEGRGQDLKGRLWDVLSMARNAIARSPAAEGADRLRVRLSVVRYDVQPRGRRTVDFVVTITGNDDGAPCFVFMFPEED